VGWLANHVRERMHGDKTYFNVNRHLNPTNVCVAACGCVPLGGRKTRPGHTLWRWKKRSRLPLSGYTEAVTEFHIVGGLHPDLPFQSSWTLSRG